MIKGEAEAMVAGTRHGIVLLLAAILPIMAVISLVPVLPLLLEEFSGTPGGAFLVPIAMTVPALCVALFSPLAGWISDKVGRKRLLVVALALYGLFGVIPWFLADLFQIIAARIALGIVEAVIMTVATVLIGDYFTGKQRESWISTQIAAGSVAAIALVGISGVLGDEFGSRGPFLLYLLALPIAVIAGLILFEPQPATDKEARGEPFPTAQLVPVITTTILVGVIFYTMIVQLGPILQLAGDASPGMIGLAGAATNLGVAFGSFVFRRLRRPAGPLVLSLGLVIAAIGYVGTGIGDSFLVIAAFAVVTCIGSGILLPNLLSWTMVLLPLRFRGRGTGVWTGAFFLGQFLAPIIATAMMVPMGGMAEVLLLYAALAISGAALAFGYAMRSAPRRVAT